MHRKPSIKPGPSARARRSRARGGILAETAIIIPVITVIILVLADIYMLSNTYMSMNQVVREGLMTAATLARARNGVQANLSLSGGAPVNECPPGAPNDARCGHYRVQWRLEQLLDNLHLRKTAVELVETEFNGTSKIFRIKVTARYTGISPYFRNFVYTIEARGTSKTTTST